LEGVEQTSRQTIQTIQGIKALMLKHKRTIRDELPKIYRQDLLNNLYRHPYTKIEYVMDEVGVSRKTASKYLDELEKIGVVTKHKIWKDNYYINNELFALLRDGGQS
jgi:Fic family protein